MKIAVCIPCHYSYDYFLERVLKSITNQTRLPDIVIISYSQAIHDLDIDGFPFKVIVYSTKDKKNMAENRNVCVKNLPSDIDIVSFFDCDDYMHQRRLEIIEKAFIDNKSLDIFVHNYQYICFRRKYDDYWNNMCKDIIIKCDHREYIFNNACVGHMSFRKSLIDTFTFSELDEHKFSSDYKYLNDCIEKKYKILYSNDKLSLYLYRCYNKFICETKLFCWWTGDNKMSENRQKCFYSLVHSGLDVNFINSGNLNEYLIEPLHEGYKYLSETQKGDYLKAYFMYFYGGGYTDIKLVDNSWVSCVKKMEDDPNIWVIGYKENDIGGVANNPQMYKELSENLTKLIGNGSYICRAKTPLTEEWYKTVVKLLDDKLEQLKKYPARHPQDCFSEEYPYPIRWAELCGEIFHPLILKYNDHVSQELPKFLTCAYR